MGSSSPKNRSDDDRSSRLARAFARQVMRGSEGSLCGACVDVLDVSGAGITLLNGAHTGPVCVSNDRSAALEDVQFILGEGPCQDAFAGGVPVHAARFDAQASGRWPTFITEAKAVGVEAVFAYPLKVSDSNVGVLTLYQDHAGDLTVDQVADTFVLADVLAGTLLQIQADAGPGIVPPELDDVLAHRAEIHQASGMVSVQLEVRVSEALAVMRAYAFSHGRSLGDVATDIVARRLRLSDPDGPAAGGTP